MSLTYLSLEILDIVYTPLQLSVWKGLKHTHQALKHVEIKSVRDIADFWKETLRITDDKAGVEYYSRGYYPSERQDAHREGPLGAILDVDETETAFAQAHALLAKADVPHAMHRSYSDGLPDKGHRYRIFLPWCAEGGAARRHLVEEVFEIIDATPKADSWSKSGLYVPTLRMNDNRKWEILVHESGTWRPSEPPVEALEREAVEAAAPDTDLDAVRGDFHPDDVRALLLFAAKNQMMDDEADWKRIAMMVAHWNHPDAETMFDEISAECSGYDASENAKHYARFRKNAAKMTTVPVTLKSLMKDAWAHGYTGTFRGPPAQEDFAEDIERERARAEQEGEEPPRVVEVDGVGMFTDIWRAQRVRQQYGHEIRWADNLSHWLNYDGVRWRMDRGLRTSQKVQEEAKVIWRKALSQPDRQKGKNPWKRAAQHAQTSTGIGHTMTLLKSQDGIKVEEMALDADIYLLNLENGTLNLRNHELQPHNPNDLITKLAPTAYKPEARCAHWDKFIMEALPDREIRDFFQRLMGYALQGGQEAKAFGIVTGPADGGKSTALLACAAALGGSSDRNEKNQDSGGAVTQAYACSTSISTFASKKQDASGNW